MAGASASYIVDDTGTSRDVCKSNDVLYLVISSVSEYFLIRRKCESVMIS